MTAVDNYHKTRFVDDPRREVLWRSLWKYFFSKYIRPTDCVLELGSGYCHFINNVKAIKRIAIDSWPEFLEYLDPNATGFVGDVADLTRVADHSVNFAFASNLVEHLSREQFDSMLNQIKKKLVPGGLLALLQPNYRYAFREYFDDFTHISVYSHVSLCDFLASKDFEIVQC